MTDLKSRLRASLMPPLMAFDQDRTLGDHRLLDLSPQNLAPWPDPDAPDPILAAVLVAIMPGTDDQVLFTRRSDHLRKHGGQVAFPGGRLDPGEDLVKTALREAEEEVGLDPALVEIWGRASPYRTMTGFLVVPIIGEIKANAPLTPNPQEVADLFTVPLAHVLDLKNHQKRHFTLPSGQERTVWSVPWPGYDIWGVTAGIIRAMSLALT